MVDLTATGPFADLVKHLADKRGKIPLPSDRKKDFDFAEGSGPASMDVTWNEYCDLCALKLREVEKKFRALSDVMVAVKENPDAFFKLARSAQSDLIRVLEKDMLILLLSRARDMVIMVGGLKKKKRKP